MIKVGRCFKCLGMIFFVVGFLLGMGHTAFADLVTFSPGTLPAGTLFPIVATVGVANQRNNYNSAEETFRIIKFDNYATTDFGGWTSLISGTANTSAIVNGMQNGNPVPIRIGDYIGTSAVAQSSIYDRVPINKDVIIPVVDTPYNIISPTSQVLGFIGFHITNSVGGSEKYVEGYFLDTIWVNGGSGSGPDYGVRSQGSTVPIPAAIWLLGSGLIGLIGIRKFKK